MLEITSTCPLRSSTPPSAFGLSDSASASLPTGGKASPPRAGARSQALATAAISMADFVPSMKELNIRSEEHTSELQSLMRISYAVFCLKKKKQQNIIVNN